MKRIGLLTFLLAGLLRAQVVINEFLPLPQEGAADANQTHQWVELWNKGAAPVSLTGWALTDRAGREGGRVKNLPAVSLPAGGFLVLHIATGTDQPGFGAQGAHFYTGDPAGTAFWNGGRDDIALYSGSGIEDYIAWGGFASPYVGAKAHDDAVAAQMWTRDEFLMRDVIQADPSDKYRSFEPGDSIGRDAAGSDRNVPEDFDAHGGVNSYGQSPGRGNDIPLPPPGPSSQAVTASRQANGMAKWTVLHYLLGDNDLEGPIFRNLLEIRDSGGSNADVNHVVLYDGRDPVRTWYGRVAGQGDSWASGLENLGELNMGEAQTLRDFIQRAKRDYPAERYAILFSAHGSSWKRFGPDVSHVGTRGDPDRIHMAEFSSALAGQEFELLIFDACLMAGIEVAYQVRHAARYMVASEEIVPGTGFDYTNLVNDLRANPGWDGRQLGEQILTRYGERYRAENLWTLSLIDLARVREIARNVDDWAYLLYQYLDYTNVRGASADNAQIGIRDALNRATHFNDHNYVDLANLAQEMRAEPKIPDCMKEPIQRLLGSIARAVVKNVVSADRSGAFGIHIYFPIARTFELRVKNPVTGKVSTAEPYDDPFTRLVSGDTGLAGYAPNPYALPLRARDREVETVFLQAPSEWPNVPTVGFLFTDEFVWDQFLDRHYHPVAEVLALEGPNRTITQLPAALCETPVDVVQVPVGGSADFTGAGSSDADTPTIGTPTHYFWDKDAASECPGDTGLCVHPHKVGNGVAADTALDNADADVFLGDSNIDDVDARGVTVNRACPEARRYIVTLHTWDENHTFPFHDTRPTAEFVHPQSDSHFGIVECFAPPTGVQASAAPPFIPSGIWVSLDFAFPVGMTRTAGLPISLGGTNVTDLKVVDVTEPAPPQGMRQTGIAGRAADVSIPNGGTATVFTNKRGFLTVQFITGSVGAAALNFNVPSLPPFSFPMTIVQPLAPNPDELTVTPPAGPLTVGQTYELVIDVRRGGVAQGASVVTLTNPPGSTGTAQFVGGSQFRNGVGVQWQTNSAGRVTPDFRPIANGPVQILVVAGTLQRLVTMEATGGPASVADKIETVELQGLAKVGQQATVRWQVKSVERLMAGVKVRVDVESGEIALPGIASSLARSATGPVELTTDSNGQAVYPFTGTQVEVVRLKATVVGTTIASTVEIPVLTGAPTRAALPGPVVSALLHGASGGTKMSPGSLFSVYGQRLATATLLTSSTPWPRAMGDVTVTINGVQAPLYYVSPTQLNGQIPYETPVGTATAVLEVSGLAPVETQITIVPAAPGILIFGGNRAVAVNQDGSVNTQGTPAAPGDVMVLYFSGIGAPDQVVATGGGAPSAEPLARAKYPFTITVNGQPAEVFYLGLAPGYPALAQANFRVPSIGAGEHPLVVTVNGEPSNAGVITVQPR